jgi:hypothetical protein
VAQAEVLNQESLAKQVLQETFGYQQFRPGQETIIDTVLEGRDCLVVMPTGGGKSLCYQVPALVLGGLTVVVAADLADERPGRSAAGQRRGGGLSELDPEPRAAAGGDGRLPQRADSSAVYRPGTPDAG